MASKVAIAEYDFSEDAMGLGAFISEQIEHLSDDEFVVLVEDGDSNPAVKATFVRETLTDGSTVVNLIIKFDRAEIA